MKFSQLICAPVIAAALATFGFASAQAAVVDYTFTTSAGGNGTFSYDDTAASVGNGPFACCAKAYDAISFTFNGTSYADPLLVLYSNYGGNQFAYFTDTVGYDGFIQFNSSGTSTLTSDSASAFDGLSLASFNGDNFASIDGGQITSLKEVSAVPEPASFALFGLGLAAVAVARRKQAR